MKSLFVAAVVISVLGSGARAQDPRAPETPQQKQERLQWWREARFGMFIHWGPVSLQGTEISWSRGGERRGIEGKGEVPVEVYDNLYHRFNPVRFDAQKWVSVARSAGMKYMVLTAKHCDGFCLWPSKVDDYNIGHSPFTRDICGELARAAQADRMRIGWYYSPMDWRDPDCRTERNARYVARMQGHLRELLGNYGRIDLLWFDTDGGPAPWDQARTYALVRSLQPRIIINNRLSMGGHADYSAQEIDPRADYKTPEQHVGAFDDRHPWETCMTLGTQWSWKPNDSLKSSAQCIRVLQQCAAGDGNLLLNVGPMPSGEIEPRQVKILREIGAWMAKYGESIYGTRGGPFRNGSWGGSTRKGNFIYLHVMQWDNDRLTLPALPARITAVTALTGGNPRVEQTGGGIVVRRPGPPGQEGAAVIRLLLDRSAETLEPADVRDSATVDSGRESVALGSTPAIRYAGKGARSMVDGVRGTTDAADGNWLGFEGTDFQALFDFRSPRKIGEVAVGCLQDQNTWIFFPAKIEVSVSDDGVVFQTIGVKEVGQPQKDEAARTKDFNLSFDPVLVRFVRIRAQNVGVCPSWHQGAGGKTWVLVDEVRIE